MFKWIRDAKRLKTVEADLASTKRDLAHFEAALNACNRTRNEQAAKIDELQKKVREQTEADLMMVSMQIVQKLAAGMKKDSPNLQPILQQQAAMQNTYAQMCNYQGDGISNALSYLGGAGIGWPSPYR